jgi:hypothetical protein
LAIVSLPFFLYDHHLYNSGVAHQYQIDLKMEMKTKEIVFVFVLISVCPPSSQQHNNKGCGRILESHPTV